MKTVINRDICRISARNEMARGVNSLISGINKGDLQLDDLSEDLLEDTFQIHPPKHLDLLVRTSGETRLSDFLLWQSSETVLCFTDVLWPDFTYWHLLCAIFQFQTNYLSLSSVSYNYTKILHFISYQTCSKLRFFLMYLMQLEPQSEDYSASSEVDRRKQDFVDKMRHDKWNSLSLASETTKVS